MFVSACGWVRSCMHNAGCEQWITFACCFCCIFRAVQSFSSSSGYVINPTMQTDHLKIINQSQKYILKVKIGKYLASFTLYHCGIMSNWSTEYYLELLCCHPFSLMEKANHCSSRQTVANNIKPLLILVTFKCIAFSNLHHQWEKTHPSWNWIGGKRDAELLSGFLTILKPSWHMTQSILWCLTLWWMGRR